VPDEVELTEDDSPSTGLAVGAVLVALVAAAGAALLSVRKPMPELNLDETGFGVFAPIYFAAQAVERFLEPLASRFNPTNAKKEDVKDARENKLATQEAAKVVVEGAAAAGVIAAATEPPEHVRTALVKADRREKDALRKLRKARAERKLIWFMVATVVSCALAGVLGLGILEAMSKGQLTDYLHAIDVGMTGIVIGAGTQPLHDLIVRLQKSKENADPATKPTGQLPGTPGPPPTTPPVVSS
jgi:hypothetical protein